MTIGDRWFVAGWAGLAGFLALEASARTSGDAARLDASTEDRGTTMTIAGTYLAAAGLAPLVRRSHGFRLPVALAPAGLGLEISGLLLRSWSMRTLGHAYSRTLRVGEDQKVIEAGPYGVVRHPGYLGSIAVWTGFAMTSRHGLVVAIVVTLLGRAYHRRIDVEERLLAARLPGYGAYAERTWRMFPGIW